MRPLYATNRVFVSRALAGSVLLHGLIGVLLWQLPRPEVVSPQQAPIPIALRTVRALPDLEPEPARTTEPLPPEPAAEPEPRPAPAADPQQAPTQTRVEPEREPELETPPPAEAIDAAEAPIPLPLIPDNVDIERAHRIAVERVVDALREEAALRTFSPDDLPADGNAPIADPDADASDFNVFERAANLPRSGAAARGRQRSRLGRSLVELCNQLTGGFGLFGIVNVCADPAARADLFGHLRPEYMESLPLCSAEEDLDIEVTASETGAIGTFKCVLVPRDVRAEIYGRYDPALAGWLPAESEEENPD